VNEARPRRLIALGASNLTRGLAMLVGTARGQWGRDVDVLAALGHGRSYGATSRVLLRSLPGILESGLWRRLEELPHAPARALITDVGNDILYGSSPSQILEWVAECVARLRRHTADITLTDLPRESIRRSSGAKFLFFRSVLFPACRLSRHETLDAIDAVVTGLERLAVAEGLRFFRLRPEWYGFDPIHIRPRLWRSAWRAILDVADGAAGALSRGEAVRLYLRAPERRSILGFEQRRGQPGDALPGGARVWLY
jgi:hypothetical protein